MIPARMRRPVSVLCLIAVSAVVVGCGTQKLSVPKQPADIYHGAFLFSQRCAGCHTLSYAATRGSAVNVSTAQANNGPNFDIRCERPAARVLYAIENGGFSGGIMPQNVVVGQDAIDVAKFVATYAGRKAPSIPGFPACSTKKVEPVAAVAATTATTTTATKTAAPKHAAARKHPAAHKAKTKRR
jgi:cytochrome c